MAFYFLLGLVFSRNRQILRLPTVHTQDSPNSQSAKMKGTPKSPLLYSCQKKNKNAKTATKSDMSFPLVSVEANYPLNFFGKADTDRTHHAFASFRSVVLFPHDFALMTFYEFLGRMTIFLLRAFRYFGHI